MLCNRYLATPLMMTAVSSMKSYILYSLVRDYALFFAIFILFINYDDFYVVFLVSFLLSIRCMEEVRHSNIYMHELMGVMM